MLAGRRLRHEAAGANPHSDQSQDLKVKRAAPSAAFRTGPVLQRRYKGVGVAFAKPLVTGFGFGA